MISVYSHYLEPLGVDCTNKKPSEIYDSLRNAYNQGVTTILDNTRVFVMNDDEVNDEVLYEIWRNDSLRDLLRWVNKKIVLTLQNGSTIDISVGDLVSGLQTEITVDNKLASDLIDDSNQSNKFITVAEKNKLLGIESGAEVNIQSDWIKITCKFCNFKLFSIYICSVIFFRHNSA